MTSLESHVSGPVVAIGEPVLLHGFALAGVIVVPAGNPAEARDAWSGLPADVALVLLTPTAAAALAGVLDETAGPLAVALPG